MTNNVPKVRSSIINTLKENKKKVLILTDNEKRQLAYLYATLQNSSTALKIES